MHENVLEILFFRPGKFEKISIDSIIQDLLDQCFSHLSDDDSPLVLEQYTLCKTLTPGGSTIFLHNMDVKYY